jgi:hypothetical protein
VKKGCQLVFFLNVVLVLAMRQIIVILLQFFVDIITNFHLPILAGMLATYLWQIRGDIYTFQRLRGSLGITGTPVKRVQRCSSRFSGEA